MAEIFYSYEELKRLAGNKCNELADNFELMADFAPDDEPVDHYVAGADYLRTLADKVLFTKYPHYTGNVVSIDDYLRRKG